MKIRNTYETSKNPFFNRYDAFYSSVEGNATNIGIDENGIVQEEEKVESEQPNEEIDPRLIVTFAVESVGHGILFM